MNPAFRSSSFDRRAFFGASALAILNAPPLTGSSPAASPHQVSWLDRFRAPHRHVFDAPSHRNGAILQQVRGFLDAYRNELGLTGEAVDVVVGIHGQGFPLVFGDAIWDRFRFRERFAVSGEATLGNPFRIAGRQAAAGSSVEELQQRGARFILCNNTLKRNVNDLATAAKLPPETIHGALLGDLVGEVTVVPAMTLALHQLQERRFTYSYVG